MPTVEDIMGLLRRRGHRRTAPRERIVEIMWASKEPLPAREIHRRVVKRAPNISLDTVYRNLELLRETGLVSQINLQNRESARFELHSEDDHHHHMVCVECGLSWCLPICPVEPTYLKAASQANFTVTDHAFELYGHCGDCADAPGE